MALWPFKKRVEKLTPADLRNRLFETAGTGDAKKLHDFCIQHKADIVENLATISEIPADVKSDPVATEDFIRSLLNIAVCMANDCDAPQLWNQLQETPANSPLHGINSWHQKLMDRMKNLEHSVLIAEACAHIETLRCIPSNAARDAEAVLYLRLGDLLLHSGQSPDAEKAFQNAYRLCQNRQDQSGQRNALTGLLEVYRYQGNTQEIIRVGQELLTLTEQLGQNSDALKKRLKVLSDGEPLCRVVCMRDDVEFEVDELNTVAQGRYEFQFRRNRPSLQLTVGLTQQGNELGSAGKLTEALEKYAAARQVDPHDPDPVYQTGVCHLELKNYAQAREAFEEVERLAPGWFRCRSDRWIAQSLEDGSITDEQFRVLRVLEDGKVTHEQAAQALVKMLNKYPNFAPFYLLLGDRYREKNDLKTAHALYRKGLELVTEPDFQSRLLCAAAVILAKESPDRGDLLQKAISLDGSLVARATAKLLSL